MDDVSILDEEQFGEQLKEWFVNHFSSKDARLHKFLHNNL